MAGRRIRYLTIFSVLLSALFVFTGCGKEKKQFDFESVAAVRVFSAEQMELKEVLGIKKSQRLVDQISSIVWVEQEEEDTSEYTDWIYRIQCYDAKGEKKQNIYICSETRIMYKDMFWDAKGKDDALDLTEYEQLLESNK